MRSPPTAARLLAGDGRDLPAFPAVPRPGFSGANRKTHFDNEGPAAAEVAALYPNVRHVLVDSSATSFLDVLDHNSSIVRIIPAFQPSNEVWSNAIMALARENGITLLLNGNCSDSTSGYDRDAGRLIPPGFGRVIGARYWRELHGSSRVRGTRPHVPLFATRCGRRYRFGFAT